MDLEEFPELEKLNEAIDGTLTVLHNLQETSEDYDKVTEQLSRLMKIKQMILELSLKADETKNKEYEREETFALKKRELDLKLKELEKPDRVSKETWAVVAANLIGIGMIIGHERVNVIASKALGFIMKSR